MKLLEIPIPLCKKHQHEGIPFEIQTNNGWKLIIIPTQLGSFQCRECSGKLASFNLCDIDLNNVNLRGADFSGADLRSADLYGADLFDADLSGTKNINLAHNLDKTYWNKFTRIDGIKLNEKYKR